jgi:nitrate/TMAO reductase-like tetraheme cytochrome c subunit
MQVAVAITAVAVITIMLIGVLVVRPALADAVAGKVFAFVVLFILPLTVLLAGFQHHMENSKSTAFCLSCHTMEAHGRSLRVNDQSYIVAAHFQNRRIPREKACYTCHTTYAMFGGTKAKLNGLLHVWVQLFGTVPGHADLELYEPYQNRECLHCHDGARSYEESTPHDSMLEELRANEMSCLDCHNLTHAIEQIDELETWRPGGET